MPYCCCATTGILPKREAFVASLSCNSTCAAGFARVTRAIQ